MTDAAPITGATIEAAELLAGIRYTPAERALMLESLPEQLAVTAQRRAFALPPGIGPAQKIRPKAARFLDAGGRDVPFYSTGNAFCRRAMRTSPLRRWRSFRIGSGPNNSRPSV